MDHPFDYIVVGSGAAGGQSAYTLCMEGAQVLMLEAGRKYEPATETAMFQTPDAAPLGAVGTPDKPFGFYDATVDGGWQVPGEPYVRASEDDAGRFECLCQRPGSFARVAPTLPDAGRRDHESVGFVG